MVSQYCSSCGTTLIDSSNFCSKCGASVTRIDTEVKEISRKKDPTEWWYIVPIFFGFIGGLIMYFMVKEDNKKMANEGLVIGIVLSFIGLIVLSVVGFMSIPRL